MNIFVNLVSHKIALSTESLFSIFSLALLSSHTTNKKKGMCGQHITLRLTPIKDPQKCLLPKTKSH